MSLLPDLDASLRIVDRALWIVTAADGDRRGGLVATFVMQASIDPEQPTVVAGLAPNHFTAELVRNSRAFGLHLLTAEQLELGWRFALGSGREVDKFAGLQPTSGETGSPLLKECRAWFECRVLHEHAMGDRCFFWADVIDGGQNGDRSPVTEQQFLAAASSSQRTALKADFAADIARQRPLRAAWRMTLR